MNEMIRDYAKEAASTSSSAPSAARRSLSEANVGSAWEVFHAPHIARLSRLFSTEFRPIRYWIGRQRPRDGSGSGDNGGSGDDETVFTIRSSVRYRCKGVLSFLGSGWLSASGTIEAMSDGETLKIHFDTFWVDGDNDEESEGPRDLSGSASAPSSESLSLGDRAVTAAGRLGFIPQLATFPVLAVFDDAAVFRFPPLRSNIAIKKIT